MKTSKLFSLALGLAFLSSTAFAGNTKPKTEKPSQDSSEELYVNPLEELLAMEAIPEIIIDNLETNTSWVNLNPEEDYVNPMQEVLDMEAIPTISLNRNSKTYDFESSEVESVNLLKEVLEMEAIPAIDLSFDTALIAKK